MQLWQLLNENSGVWTLAAILLSILVYVVRSSNSLTRVETNLANYCQESSTDRRNLWSEHGKLREAHHEHSERLAKVETKIETHNHVSTRGRAGA
jgi:hypothetical protein